ncbi:hypothetical protein AMTRI_Chr05g72240 [Amborella trichopoda]
MVSPKLLLSTVESTLLSSSSATSLQRLELMHTLRSFSSALQSLLSYPGPKASDRAHVLSKEVRLPDASIITLDGQDVQIVIKLSDDLNLNEIDSVVLLVSAHQEWGLFGREPLEILRLAEGLWYTERRALLTSLYTLMRAVVLDQGLDTDLASDILQYLEDLLKSGLRQRLINLLKELNREDPSGLGGPQAEHYILDSRGALVERKAVVLRERLTISHCLVLSVLILRINPKDAKDIFVALKDSIVDLNGGGTVTLQTSYSLFFGLVISLTSDALSTVRDKVSALSIDDSFRHEFQDLVVAPGIDPSVGGFVDSIRFAWAVYLMITVEGKYTSSGVSSVANICSCLEHACMKNVFQFSLDKIVQTPAYQNDDEDMIYMYNAYLHKLMMCFLSHPIARDKVKEMKEKAMSALSPYSIGRSHDLRSDENLNLQQDIQTESEPFISLLELVSEIYQKEPDLIVGNEVLWTFVNFAGEGHTSFQTLVAFLRMLSTLGSNEEGAIRIFQLLQGKALHSIGWNTLFDCLSVYEQKFKQSLQSTGTVLPEFQEGDAKALVAYLGVLQKVVENGNPVERTKWFPDIEPLFKLLGYENVPTYLKGALRNAISAFIEVSPVLKDTIWNYLEQYDLPLVVGPPLVGYSSQQVPTQVYDMRYELNEVEARSERYPSTISFLNLLNALIAKERDVSDRGRRFVGIFRFVYDHVFGPFPQQAYADPMEKWQLVVACLRHFQMILNIYDIVDEDIENVVEQSSQFHNVGQPLSSLETQIPVIELMKDFMSGRMVFRNIMSIVSHGVNGLLTDRTGQIYGHFLEEAVRISLEIIVLVFAKDLRLADYWRPFYQPLDAILSQDRNQIVALLEYVRYDFCPEIQKWSIKIMGILSSRMAGLVPLLLESNASNNLIEDYAACLEMRAEECLVTDTLSDDIGVMILQLLIDNISRPAPNLAHLLLKYDVDTSVDRTVLQPKYHYSCLRVILDILERLQKPDANALLHEFGFQLLYELCLDPLTGRPTMDLLCGKKYQFFLKYLGTLAAAPLPKRNVNQALRISDLQQRAWLLKLLALEMHMGDDSIPTHRELCLSLLNHLFIRDTRDSDAVGSLLPITSQRHTENVVSTSNFNSKVLEILDVIQFRSPDTALQFSQSISKLSRDMKVEDILGSPATTENGGVYYYSERGDRLIDLAAFRDKLWQMCNNLSPQQGSLGEDKLAEIKESIQQLLRWGWKYNKNLEEQAAQLHMLIGWSQIVEVSISRRLLFLEYRSQILFDILDASLSSSASPDCSVKMAVILSQVALTCMAKLRDERFLSPGGDSADNITYLDIISVTHLSNGACHSILLKLIMAILRPESSELLRKRQYSLLLSYFQYCRSLLNPDVPVSILYSLLAEGQDGGEDVDMQKIDNDQTELDQTNFCVLKREAKALLDVVTKDAMHGSEVGKAISFYVLDTFITVDQEHFFLTQLQSRGFLRASLSYIGSFPGQENLLSVDYSHRSHTLEAKLALLLRVGHNYKKQGSQVLLSMGILEHLTSCKALNMQVKVRNKIVREVIDFIKAHQWLFDQVLRVDISQADELTLELIDLIVSILSKVWPYEEQDDLGFVPSLFGMMRVLFSLDAESFQCPRISGAIENSKATEFILFRLCYNLASYLYFLVMKKYLKLQVSDSSGNYHELGGNLQPTLMLLVGLLNLVTTALGKAVEEKSFLLAKIQDINELPRHEVDEILDVYKRQDSVAASDNIRKRRYIAMVEMCKRAGNRDRLIKLLLQIVERVLDILFSHFQDRKNGQMRVDGISAGSKEEVSVLSQKLMPTLERLEVLSEDKMRQNLKVFQRLVSSLKEAIIQHLSS